MIHDCSFIDILYTNVIEIISIVHIKMVCSSESGGKLPVVHLDSANAITEEQLLKRRRIKDAPSSEVEMEHNDTHNPEPLNVLVRNSELKEKEPPTPWFSSSRFVEEFTFIPADNPKMVRILCQDYEFKKESIKQENQKWRCTADGCTANLMFIESASTFTDVHLQHNHPPPDLSSHNMENAMNMKLCPPVPSVKRESHRIKDEGTLDTLPLPLDPHWEWDGPEPLREAVSEGYPPLPPTDQHCPICFMNRSKFDVWKCQACTSTMKSWRNKLRYSVPPSLPECYHSLFQPKFNCNGCRRRRLQWEWTHRQTRPLGLPLVQY